MSNAQSTVIVLLLVLFALEAARVPSVKAFITSTFGGFAKGVAGG
jgi:hypothetical protein